MSKFIQLLEAGYGIPHLEDLAVDEMARLLKNLKNLRAVQKLDGSNLHLGVDLKGRVYTSREQKGGARFYSAEDFPKRSAYDGFKSATLALLTVQDTVKRVLEKGQELSLEILYGQQPNTVDYGSTEFSYIALLEPAAGDDPTNMAAQQTVDELHRLLKSKTVNITTIGSTSTDGKQLVKQPVVTAWRFIVSDPIPEKLLRDQELTTSISKIESFLGGQNRTADQLGERLTNYEVLLSKLPKLSDAKKAASASLQKLVEPIKQRLLAVTSALRPSISPKATASPGTYQGVEGLLFKDPDSGEAFKVVDADNFSLVNKFNYSIRNRLVGKVLTVDDNASLEARGGLLGVARTRCISIFGVKGAELPSQARKILAPFAEMGERLGTAALEKSFSQLSLESVKRKCGAIFTHALIELDDELDSFKAKPPKLKLAGKELELSLEVKRRTLVTFAETAAELERLIKRVRVTGSLSELFIMLVGKGTLGWD